MRFKLLDHNRQLFEPTIAHPRRCRPNGFVIGCPKERSVLQPIRMRVCKSVVSEAAYVGDSPFDIGAAKAAGVYAVAVGWGGIHPDERLLAEGPDAFVRTPEELLRVI